MSESFVNPLFGPTVAPAAQVEVPVEVPADFVPEGTGHPEVDAVVGSLEALDGLDVSEHVAVFEQAHESLRRTLAGAGANSATAGRG